MALSTWHAKALLLKLEAHDWSAGWRLLYSNSSSVARVRPHCLWKFCKLSRGGSPPRRVVSGSDQPHINRV